MAEDSIPASRIRAAHRLSALKVSKLAAAGLYEDGAGLRLVVTDLGTKRWALRMTIQGRRVERGLGLYPDVSLEEARHEASRLRGAAKQGIDRRREEREKLKARCTFEESFEIFFAVRERQLSNPKHRQQWRHTMRDYVMPVIGRRPVADVAAAEIVEILTPIWFSKPETASRVLQRLRAVFDSAILRGTRERANPTIGVSAELGTDHRRVQHHQALPWSEVPKFVLELRQRPTTLATRLAFEFLILTAARSGEARGALWSEFDLDKRLWTIPGFDPVTGRRMKTGELHTVPLSTSDGHLSEARYSPCTKMYVVAVTTTPTVFGTHAPVTGPYSWPKATMTVSFFDAKEESIEALGDTITKIRALKNLIFDIISISPAELRLLSSPQTPDAPKTL